MGKIRRIIPFGMWPANWGLSGSRRAKTEAEYYWDGEDLAYKLLDLDFPDALPNDKEYRTAKLKLDYRYHKITEFDYGQGIIENDVHLSEESRERELAKYLHRFGRMTAEELEYKLFELSYAVKGTETYNAEKLKLDIRFGKKTQEEADHELLDLKYKDKTSPEFLKEQLALERKYGNISQNEFEKETATLDKEPWFNFVGADKRISGDSVQAAVELDWNTYFVEYLESQGWTGATPDEVVDRWFEAMMKNMLNVMDDEVIDDGSTNPMPMAGQNRFKRDDGLTEYR